MKCLKQIAKYYKLKEETVKTNKQWIEVDKRKNTL